MGHSKLKNTRISHVAFVAFLFLISPNLTLAWLSESAVKEAQDLIEYTGQEGVCPDPERLTFLIAFNGLACLSKEHLDLIGEEFESFSSIIANSQKPPLVPNCWVQTFCRQFANDSQREEMLVSLRAWLTEDITEVRTGSMGMSGQPATIHGVLDATESLVGWRDESAVGLIEDYLSRNNIDEKFRPHFELLKRRLIDPCEKSLFQVLPNGTPVVCYGAAELPSIILQSSDFRSNKTEGYVLSNQEKQDFVDLVNTAHVGVSFQQNGLGRSYYLVVRFDDGYKACIQIPSRGTSVIFYDNDPAESCLRVKLESERLFSWGKNLINTSASKSNN